MLRLTDVRTGSVLPLAGPGARAVLVGRCACAVDAVVLADVVRRLGELRKLRVTVHQFPCGHGHPPVDAVAWNAHPAVAGPPAGPLRVYVGDTPPPGPPPRIHVPAAVTGADVGPDLGADGVVARPAGGDARIAARLSMLCGVPTAQAAADLTRLRARTARLAESASAALPAGPVAAVLAALEDDLAGDRAWDLLLRLADDEALAPGARFEAMAYLDRAFGLELARDVGRA